MAETTAYSLQWYGTAACFSAARSPTTEHEMYRLTYIDIIFIVCIYASEY